MITVLVMRPRPSTGSPGWKTQMIEVRLMVTWPAGLGVGSALGVGVGTKVTADVGLGWTVGAGFSMHPHSKTAATRKGRAGNRFTKLSAGWGLNKLLKLLALSARFSIMPTLALRSSR